MISISRAASSDVREVMRAKPDVAEHILTYWRTSAQSWVGAVDGRVACLWGLIAPTLLSERGYLWLQTTPLVDEHAFLFVRHSQLVVREMLKHTSPIFGHCHCSDARAQRWVKWLGGKFSPDGGLAIPFRIE